MFKKTTSSDQSGEKEPPSGKPIGRRTFCEQAVKGLVVGMTGVLVATPLIEPKLEYEMRRKFFLDHGYDIYDLATEMHKSRSGLTTLYPAEKKEFDSLNTQPVNITAIADLGTQANYLKCYPTNIIGKLIYEGVKSKNIELVASVAALCPLNRIKFKLPDGRNVDYRILLEKGVKLHNEHETKNVDLHAWSLEEIGQMEAKTREVTKKTTGSESPSNSYKVPAERGI